ncbi:MAG TPA: type III pantothenate kinase [Candidatus Eisenbacteria bacterium]
MLLAADIGNTEATVGLFDGSRLLRAIRLARAEWRAEARIERALRKAFPELERAGEGAVAGAAPAAGLASVVPAETPRFAAAMRRLTGSVPLEISTALDTGLVLEYRDPTTLGADRLANAVAGVELYGAPVIVVDLGTATKFEVIVPERRYRGGVIAPGIRTAADELIRRAARLGAFELHVPERVVGRSTEECLQSGVLLGAAGMVDAVVRRIAAEERIRPAAVATGGLAPLVAPLAETVERIDPELTLQGIRLVHERNVRRSG